MSYDDEILRNYLSESLDVINQALKVLNDMESNFSQIEDFKIYANLVDRVMGTTQSLILMVENNERLQLVSDYTTLFKVVANLSLKLNIPESLYNIVVALLIDATETLDQILQNFNKSHNDIKKLIQPEFLDRVRLVKSKLSPQQNSVNFNEIDELLFKISQKI